MGNNYGISEIARELGVSRQRVHQKIKKCQNPYIKYPTGRPRIVKELKEKKLKCIVLLSEVTVPGWICSKCGHPNPTHKTPDKYKSRVVCRGCKRGFVLIGE